jgi:lipoprotein-anchoring transpeptidase ErfK/SrfK
MDNENEEKFHSEARFNNYLKSNLIHLHKNLYLNRTDPLYFEKILRYSNPKSAEAHYMLAQKYEKESNAAKALLHYQEAASDRLSPFYAKAKDRMRRIQRRDGSRDALTSFPTAPMALKKPRIILRKPILTFLIAFNLILLSLLLLNLNTIRAVVSSVMSGVGMEVVYETVDEPYVLYISKDTTNTKVEKILYSKASEMGQQHPRHNIQLYGIMTADPALYGKTIPLSSEQSKIGAFVIAQFNASIDQAVKIQFRNNEASHPAISQQTKADIPMLTSAASNLVKTALEAFINENKAPPAHIENLIGDYPNNYLSFIPNEVQSGNNKIAAQFDGSGGWVYNPLAKGLSSMFYPNIIDEATAMQAPYSPVKLLISRNEHTLLLVTGSTVLARKPVGIGKENRTPEGSFTIQDRVMNPLGNHPDVYGKAGLSMGKYAIHGTYDQTSISANKSLGCVRLSNPDILALFPIVPKGTAVQISNDLPSAFQKSVITDPIRLLPAQKPQINERPLHHIFNWLG